jgi:hypothetical protein
MRRYLPEESGNEGGSMSVMDSEINDQELRGIVIVDDFWSERSTIEGDDEVFVKSQGGLILWMDRADRHYILIECDNPQQRALEIGIIIE